MVSSSKSSSIPLVLLPGLLNDSRLWRAQIDGLSDVAKPQVADLTGADTIRTLAAAVLAAVPAPKFALAGLSMGGYVALEIMRQAPDRVMALALLDTSARADTPEATENRRQLMSLAETDFLAVTAKLLPKLLTPTQQGDPAIVDVIYAMANAAGKDAFLRQQRAIMGRADSRPHLAAIHCPTLVLCGREDAITPVAIHEELQNGIAGSQLRVIDQCGHLSTLGQPQQVTQALREWLIGIQAGFNSSVA